MLVEWEQDEAARRTASAEAMKDDLRKHYVSVAQQTPDSAAWLADRLANLDQTIERLLAEAALEDFEVEAERLVTVGYEGQA